MPLISLDLIGPYPYFLYLFQLLSIFKSLISSLEFWISSSIFSGIQLYYISCYTICFFPDFVATYRFRIIDYQLFDVFSFEYPSIEGQVRFLRSIDIKIWWLFVFCLTGSCFVHDDSSIVVTLFRVLGALLICLTVCVYADVFVHLNIGRYIGIICLFELIRHTLYWVCIFFVNAGFFFQLGSRFAFARFAMWVLLFYVFAVDM